MSPTANRWEPLIITDDEREKIWATNRSFGQDVWFRFSHKKSAFISLIVLLIVGFFSVAGPFMSPYSYSEQTLELANLPPRLATVELSGYDCYFYLTPSLKLIELTKDGELVRQLRTSGDDAANKRFRFAYSDEQIILVDYSQKPAALLDESDNRILPQQTIWNKTYRLGTDHLGRDILTRLMYGCRISLIVALIAACVNMVIGTVYGGISGYLGGRVDAVMMRIVDIISTIPLTLYVILIKVTLQSSGFTSIIIALSSVYWVDMARVVRGEVLKLRSQEFIMASRTIGTSTRDIFLRHLVPNTMGSILVTVTMLIPSAIFMEAFMSYIGIGIAPPMASLGTMCNDATEALRTQPYQLLWPAALICIVMFAFNFLGDGLRDALDPKLKK